MNPYAEAPDAPITSMNDLFGNWRLVPTKKRETERGLLMEYFSQRTGKTIGQLCGRFIPPGLTLQDLYVLKSKADQDEGRWYTDKKDGQRKQLTWTQVFYQSLKA